MGNRIANGAGKTRFARVDESLRLHTRGVVQTELDLAVMEERAFQCTTAEVSLTSANESAVFFFQNDETKDIIVDSFQVVGFDLTGNTKDYFKFTRHVQATAISATNTLRTGSSTVGGTGTLSATAWEGAEAATLTGGVSLPPSILEINRSHVIDNVLARLPPGATISIKLTPPTGSSAMTAVVAMRLWVVPTDDK